MKRITLKASIVLGVVACAALASGREAKSDASPTISIGAVYGNVSPDQAEFLTPGARIVSVATSGAPMAIWEALEHGEKVECLECIAVVEPLLYDTNARTREISAWWLRRRIFGVFGPGEAYEHTLNALKSDPSAQRRANAAHALGEFLITPGVAACATALATDSDPGVRAAAASALGRLNDDGNGALLAALKDGDESVRIAAITSAGRVSTFADAKAFTAGLASLTGDPSAHVRRRAVELLDSLRASESVAAMIALAKGDNDDDVRISACHALGAFQDKSAQPTLEYLAQNDPNGLVRDMALIALRRL